MTNPLVKLDKATHLLAEAKTLDEIKNIMDVAEAARTYARAAKLGLEAYNHAAEVKVRAERKAGEFLKRLERIPGQRTDKPHSILERGSSQYSDVLKENAIPTTSAYRWQQLADMPELVFEKQGKKCNICRIGFDKVKPTQDHIIPVSKGGHYTKENIQALCGSCNSRKRDR